MSAALLVLVTSALALLVGPAFASAHTGFESSTPGDGTVLVEPVNEVTIVFTGVAIPVGDKFTALDPAGQLRSPSDVFSGDGKTFVLTFDPPLADGQVGVRWSVQAPDAHPIEGTFVFTVNVPVETTEPPILEAAEVAPLIDDSQSPQPASEPAPTLEEFLAVDSSRPGEGVALAGRVLGLLGVVFVLGGIGFMATTLRGSRSEIRTGLNVVGGLGLVVAVGALLELVGLVRAGGTSLGSFADSPGLGMMLRLVGGLTIGGGVIAMGQAGRRKPAHSLSSAVLEARPRAEVRQNTDESVRWYPESSMATLIGAAAIVISFWFDGHTVSKGPRVVHALFNSVHVVAGSVWAGGVVWMAVVAWWRYRQGRPTRAAELVVRFSSIAAVALIAAGAAGMMMAVFVLDSVNEVTSTEWGRILLLKTSAVAIAAAGGAYNHFRLLPALEAAPYDEELAAELRSTVTAEAIILVFVIMVTAWLVSAAS